jgi:hypothetical protein
MSAETATAVRVGEFSFNRVTGSFTFAVEPDGTFVVEAFGEEFRGDSLDNVREQVYQAALAMRHEVPFVRTDLHRGVIRGWHAGRDVLLVTYEERGLPDRVPARHARPGGDARGGALLVLHLAGRAPPLGGGVGGTVERARVLDGGDGRCV